MWTWVTHQSDSDGSETKSIFETGCSTMAYGIEMLLKSSPTGFGTLLNMSPHSPWTVYVIDARMYGRLEQLPEATHDFAAI